jgi:VWFA-related protein
LRDSPQYPVGPTESRRQFLQSLVLTLGTPVLSKGVVPQQPLRVDVSLVNVFLTVQDPSGAFITGLNSADFRVYEDGNEQNIAIFERQNVPSAVGVLLDNSLSMVDILPIMKDGLLEFARHKESFRELFVMSFGATTRTLHDVGRPIGQLESNLKQLGVQGTSVLFDALIVAMQKVRTREPERKALIVFTDGIDTASKAGYRDVLLETQKSGVLLYFIPIGARVLIDERTLDSLARDTGGRSIYLTKSQPVSPAIEEIRKDLDRQYYIGYYARRTPGFHSIRVEVPGRNVRIRAKTGYYG